MATDASTPKDAVPGSGPYAPGPNRYTDGGTTVDDVTPLADRSDGTSEEAQEKAASVSRQQS